MEKNLVSRIDKLKFNQSKICNVSIIIPSYEALEDITECIDSILSLNDSKWIEIIVIDNKSSQKVVDYLDQLES